MKENKFKILAVDDEKFNLDLLRVMLENSGFEVICAEDGKVALAKLKEVPNISIIVLDRVMPNMDGMQVMKALQSDPLFKHIPVIMQTAANENKQMMEGIQAGVYYYMTKPYNKELLLGIIRRALQDGVAQKELLEGLRAQRKALGLVQQARFQFRTLEDISIVANYVANCCPYPDKVIYGLSELMINAVEHGNLSISYTEKMELVLENCWRQEVERRLSLPDYAEKFGILTFEADKKYITITIKDQGKGFNWTPYLDFDPIRIASDPHGRGIAIAKATSFPDMKFMADGTEVVCRLPSPYHQAA